MTISHYTIHTDCFSYGPFAAESEAEALDAFGRMSGRASFADLAERVGMTAEEMRAEIFVKVEP